MRHSAIAVAVVLIAGLSLVACGDDSSGDPDGGTPTGIGPQSTKSYLMVLNALSAERCDIVLRIDGLAQEDPFDGSITLPEVANIIVEGDVEHEVSLSVTSSACSSLSFRSSFFALGVVGGRAFLVIGGDPDNPWADLGDGTTSLGGRADHMLLINGVDDGDVTFVATPVAGSLAGIETVSLAPREHQWIAVDHILNTDVAATVDSTGASATDTSHTFYDEDLPTIVDFRACFTHHAEGALDLRCTSASVFNDD